jgi:hypothetical protein
MIEKIIRRDRVRCEIVLYGVKGGRNILLTINRRNTSWINHILRMNCLVNKILKKKNNLVEEERNYVIKWRETM